MPTKPDPVNDLPPAWGGAGLYVGGVYGPFLPWGAVNPNAGDPLPWTAQPRLNSTGLTAFADNGLTPQEPNDASVFNEWLRRVQVWDQWVALGTSAPDLDAHLVETENTGNLNAAAFTATFGFQNGPSGAPTPAELLMGANVPANETLSMEANTTLAGTNTTVAQIGYMELLPPATPPVARQLSTNLLDQMVWSLGAAPTDLRLVHYSPNGRVYATGDQEADSGLLAAHNVATTTDATKGLGAGNVRVIVEGQMQVSILGSTVTISAQEDQTANPLYTDIGTVQQITALKTTADANDWQQFRHERIFLAGITDATLYRCRVVKNGGGSVKVKEVRLRVESERA